WELLIAAGDKTLSIGHSPYSEIGLDRLDRPQPPASPYGETGAFLFEEDGFTYSRSIRPDGSWEIILPRLTDLSWDPNSVPLEGLTLIADGKSIDMRTVGYASVIGNTKIVAGDALPNDFALDPVFPNPFNPTCEIPFSLPEASNVNIEIFDMTGRQVARLVDSEFSAGRHSVKWHGVDETGREVPGGLYLCRMTSGSFVETRRMLLLK
ncbi:MAG TPA: T9SS type A sorting domain-containing protein, partial [candidate division Zixibacteria bacterium]|nr:T9SS type A sorting domain-containing protein [candidate division Zixibacteria bacterium]